MFILLYHFQYTVHFNMKVCSIDSHSQELKNMVVALCEGWQIRWVWDGFHGQFFYYCSVSIWICATSCFGSNLYLRFEVSQHWLWRIPSWFSVSIDVVLDWISALLTTFNTQIVTAPNFSTITDIHTLQITGAHRLVFKICCSLHLPFLGNGF